MLAQVSKFLPVRSPFTLNSINVRVIDSNSSVGKDYFEEEPEPQEDPAAAAAAAATQAAQAEKRKLRKEAAAAAAVASGSVASLLPSASAVAAVETTTSSLPEQERPQPKQAHVRGKSGQRKKMKEKYRDQGVEPQNFNFEVPASLDPSHTFLFS